MEKIRKITIGGIKDGISYPVGKDFGKVGVIHRIYFDEEFFDKTGEVRYNIDVKPPGVKYTRLWKSFSHESVSLEYDTTLC